jgi:hypothetical protein
MPHLARARCDRVARLALAASVLVLGAAGCASTFAVCPAQGGPPWRELANEHFVLRTDQDLEAARATLRDLDVFRAAVLTCFHAPIDLDTGRLPVIAVRDGWGEFAGTGADGLFTEALFRPLIVLRTRSRTPLDSIIKHELVHYFSKKVVPAQPLWFAEGLATYFESVEYDLDRQRMVVGRPPKEVLSFVQRVALLRADEMRAMKQLDEERTPFFYATAWATIHFLMNHRADQLRAYEAALLRSSDDAAWAQAFPDLKGDALDAELHQYLDGGAYSLLIFPFHPPPLAISEERALTDAEVHGTRAFLLAVGSHLRGVASTDKVDHLVARATQEIDEALRQDPDQVLAQAVRTFTLGVDPRVADALRATEKSPNDWLAWLLLAEALHDEGVTGQRVVAAVQKAVDLASEDLSVSLQLRSRRPLAPPPAPPRAPDRPR